LASTQIRQKWRIFGEYSNSTNSLSSGHCLVSIPFYLSRNRQILNLKIQVYFGFDSKSYS
jgi:hypothetical protein